MNWKLKVAATRNVEDLIQRGETCLLQEPITSCPDYDYDLGLYVHVAGCGCARREWE